MATAKSVLCAMILSADYARGIMEQLHFVIEEGDKHRGLPSLEDPDHLLYLLHERLSTEHTQYFCCAIILLEVIRQNADLFRNMNNIEHCLAEWKDVYLC